MPFYKVLTSSVYDIIENYQNRFNYWHGRRYNNIVHVIDSILPEPKFRFKKVIEHFDRENCLDILIDWDLNVTTLLYNDKSALFHAVNRNNVKAICKLLSKGSFIGSVADFCDPNICNIDAKLLDKHFDSCITRCVDDDRFIEINFKNLIASPKMCDKCDSSCFDEMKAIELIANSNDHKHLLVHPLISTFVLLKWNRLAFMLYIDFILYSLFTLSTAGYIFAIENQANAHITITLLISTAILTIYAAERRILHAFFGKFHQATTLKCRIVNYFQGFHTALIIIFVVILLLNLSAEYRPVFSTICILFIAIKMFTLAGSLFWSFSKYYVMFLDVALSSIKSLQLCVILLPAFTMSFYLLKSSNTASNSEGSNVQSDKPIMFNQLTSSLIKTVAMSTGEFEVDNNNFHYTVMSTYLFLGFLFVITVVFMNLMNGLAVDDTQRIQSDAEATSLIQRVRLLAHYEGIKSHKLHWFK